MISNTLYNPYVAGPPVTPPHFYGRSQLLTEIHDPNYTCFYLVGLRRIGKTSLLKSLKSIAPQNVLPIFINLQRAVGLNGLDETRLNMLLIKSITNNRKWELEVPAIRHTSLSDTLELILDSAGAKNIGIWLLWDEADLLKTLPKESLQSLRSILLENPNLKTILTASIGLGGLNDACRNWQVSPFLYGFATRFISTLNEWQAKSLIEQSDNPEGPVKVENETIFALWKACRGHPFLLQAICSRLYDQSQRRLRPVTDFELQKMFNEEDLASVFQQDFDNLSPSQRKILKYLANYEPSNEDSIKKVVKLPIEGIRAHLTGLIQIGLLFQENGQYRLGFDLLRWWLRSGMVEEHKTRLSDQAFMEIVEGSEIGELSPVMFSQILNTRVSLEKLHSIYRKMNLSIPHIDKGTSKPGQVHELIQILTEDGRLAELRDLLEKLPELEKQLELGSLYHQLHQLNQNLFKVQEKKASFMDPRSCPPELVENERQLVLEIEAVKNKINLLGVLLPSS